ncbi:hypothetical protein C8T65DRAFT_158970 [Cerioporus squamosus]|nr:hypothetical protein C8T65DRAFT_158970 [Cerioporus squamosus]
MQRLHCSSIPNDANRSDSVRLAFARSVHTSTAIRGRRPLCRPHSCVQYKAWLSHGWYRNNSRPLATSGCSFDFAMSSDADAAAATVALFDSVYTEYYCSFAAGVLFIYDAFITFDREVACFWTAKRPGGASLLFFSNKWIFMTLNFTVFLSFVSFSSDKFSGENFLPFGCLETDSTTAALTLKYVVIIARVPLIAADILLIYITWIRLSTCSWGAPRDTRQSKRLPLSEVLFQGGVIYFIILFILNVLHLIFSATAVASENENQSYVTTFTAPYAHDPLLYPVMACSSPLPKCPFCSITAIFISRFLLALQESNQTVVRLDPDNPLYSSRNQYDSTPATPSFISPLGGFINPDLLVWSNDDGLELQVRTHSEAPEEEEDIGQTGFHQAIASSSATP